MIDWYISKPLRWMITLWLFHIAMDARYNPIIYIK